jgi:uncharacterized protein YceK
MKMFILIAVFSMFTTGCASIDTKYDAASDGCWVATCDGENE